MHLNKRSSEIDFLRGVAVLLVLCSHHWFFQPLNEMGWVGVDLFFVLSGFLVSGLLFQEYIKYGNIKPGLFLIRRGFKIYPLFYLAIFITLALLLFFPNSYVFPESQKLFLNKNGIFVGLLIEIFFVQSYFFGFWGHTWSLSVEEYFYFGLVLLFYWMIKRKKLDARPFFIRFIVSILILVLLFRLVSNILFPSSLINYSAYHLRIDSLFAGVLISYGYYFNREKLEGFYNKYKIHMRLLFIPLLCYVPFVNVLESFFVKTVGFTLIYIAFSFLLLHFIFEPGVMFFLQKWFGRITVKMITKIGFYSYGIYLFHVFIMRYIVGEGYAKNQYIAGHYSYLNVLESFALYFLGSILIGIGMSKLVELPMLRLRDKYFPRRTA